MPFEIVSEITDIATIARALVSGTPGRRWRKMKGRAVVRLRSGRIRRAELHWYEAHGIGRKEVKRNRYVS